MTAVPAHDIIFVHIPKTGGTSFRKSLMAAQPCDYNLLDYGLEAKETSAIIRETVYRPDRISIRERIGPSKSIFISGHFKLSKYDQELPDAFRLAFVRYPVSQVVSHYRHFVSRLGYAGTLAEFCKTPLFQNIQSQYIGVSAIDRFDFIGVLEWFSIDIVTLSARLGASMPPLHLNKLGAPAPLLTAQEIDMIESCNAEDMALFAAVVARRSKAGAARRA